MDFVCYCSSMRKVCIFLLFCILSISSIYGSSSSTTIGSEVPTTQAGSFTTQISTATTTTTMRTTTSPPPTKTSTIKTTITTKGAAESSVTTSPTTISTSILSTTRQSSVSTSTTTTTTPAAASTVSGTKTTTLSSIRETSKLTTTPPTILQTNVTVASSPGSTSSNDSTHVGPLSTDAPTPTSAPAVTSNAFSASVSPNAFFKISTTTSIKHPSSTLTLHSSSFTAFDNASSTPAPHISGKTSSNETLPSQVTTPANVSSTMTVISPTSTETGSNLSVASTIDTGPTTVIQTTLTQSVTTTTTQTTTANQTTFGQETTQSHSSIGKTNLVNSSLASYSTPQTVTQHAQLTASLKNTSGLLSDSTASINTTGRKVTDNASTQPSSQTDASTISTGSEVTGISSKSTTKISIASTPVTASRSTSIRSNANSTVSITSAPVSDSATNASTSLSIPESTKASTKATTITSLFTNGSKSTGSSRVTTMKAPTTFNNSKPSSTTTISSHLSSSTFVSNQKTSNASFSRAQLFQLVSSTSTAPALPHTTNPLLTSQFTQATSGPTPSTTQLTTSPDPCSDLVCEHGNCTINGTTATCKCLPGYSGTNCSVDIDDCKPNPCLHGNCSDLVNAYHCSCNPGYTGTKCEEDIDDCLSNPCKYGNCTDLVNDYRCSCYPGYNGSMCEQDIDECNPNPCKHGNCTNMVNAYRCSCYPGYTGPICDVDIDECISKPCLNGGTCHDLVNGFNCSCVLGYNGTTCQNNIDDCVNSKCKNGATCIDRVNNYTCTCASEWEGTLCDHDIDECQKGTHRCSKFANCTNQDGGYNCSCNLGFIGDGLNCQDINECTNGSLNKCDHGTCFNLFGSYSCVCNSGWNGSLCDVDIDECSSNPCWTNAECKNRNGSYSCLCNEGYRTEDKSCVYKVLYDVVANDSHNIRVLRDDDAIRQVYLPQGLRYFGKMYYYAYVSTNGYISLGKHYYSQNPPSTGDNWPRDPPVIAPLWADIDVSNTSSGVYINSLTYDYNADVLQNFTAVCGFEPTYALMVTWKNAPPYPAKETLFSEIADFQVVIASNGTDTKVIFNYDQTRFTWQVAPGRFVAIGYSNEIVIGGSALFDSKQFLSAKSNSNTNTTGRWVFEVTSPSSSSDPTIAAEARCRNMPTKAMEYIISDYQEPCPCTYDQAFRDRRFRYFEMKNGVYKFKTVFSSGVLRLRQLCHYDQHGSLLVGEPNGGYKTTQAGNFNLEDVYNDCCVNSKLCELFYLKNPSDTCRNYRPPSWASGWGDPHIITLDGKSYTFNGRGEYVLLRTNNIGKGNLEVQVRTDLVNMSSTDSTVFVGVAAQEKDVNGSGDIVEIQLNRTTQAVHILINHTLNTTYQHSETLDIQGENFVLYNITEGLVLTFPSGFSLQIGISDILNLVATAQTNTTFLSNMRGLLGNNDGNKDNDFLARNGTLFSANSTEEQLWLFGTSWMLQNVNESLFTYSSQSDFAFHNNRSIKPTVFIDKYLQNWTNFITFVNNSCKGSITEKDINETCNGTLACLVDVALTCKQSFGSQTTKTQLLNRENANIAANNPPTIQAPTDFLIRAGEPTQTYIDITDDHDNHLTNTPVMSKEFSFENHNSTTYALKWNITTVNSSDHLPYFKLTVTDSMNASRIYQPTFYYCDCNSVGECDDLFGNIQNSTRGGFIKLSCNCESGRTGPRCESKVNPCELKPCYNASSCKVVNDKPQCGPCPQGLSGDGNKCYDINECEKASSTCNQICINTFGSFNCGCKAGFYLGEDKFSCIDVDECQTGVNNCSLAANQVCVNKPGSYECMCRPGFINESNLCQQAIAQYVGVLTYTITRQGQGDDNTTLKAFLSSVFNSWKLKFVSIEIIQNDQHKIQKREASPSKETSAKYILTSKTSTDTNTVADIWKNYTTTNENCDESQCMEMVDGHGLVINSELSKIYGDQDNMLCQLENLRCDAVSTVCSSAKGIITCLCRPGFSKVEGVLDRCADNDECQSLSSPCKGGECINTPGNYTCRCPAGYGLKLGICTDMCSSSPCQNGGTCIHGSRENEFICKCDDKWAGQTCERENEETSRLHTALIAVGASIGAVCFLMLMAMLGMCRRNRQKYKSYLHKRAMSSLNGYESSKLTFHDEPLDDDLDGPSTFTIPRPKVSGQFEMQAASRESGSKDDDVEPTKFEDPAKPNATEGDKDSLKGHENPSFLHSVGSLKEEPRRSKNPYEYF